MYVGRGAHAFEVIKIICVPLPIPGTTQVRGPSLDPTGVSGSNAAISAVVESLKAISIGVEAIRDP